MAGQSRKWMILVATIWIQAFTGTNFDFSTYSSDLKSVLGISQVQLNYLAVASDLGKVFGWSSGLALLYFPLWTVLFAAAIMGFVGYGVQWLVITNVVSLPYILVIIISLNISVSWAYCCLSCLIVESGWLMLSRKLCIAKSWFLKIIFSFSVIDIIISISLNQISIFTSLLHLIYTYEWWLRFERCRTTGSTAVRF